MENRKQDIAILQDELIPIAIPKTRGEKLAPERHQSDPSQELTPERPQSSLRYNTPMTPEYSSRPRAVSYGWKGSISSDDELEPEGKAIKSSILYLQLTATSLPQMTLHPLPPQPPAPAQ